MSGNIVHSVRRADLNDLDHLAPLFDQYRMFYGQPSDITAAHEFLRLRLELTQSTIFLASDANGLAQGFVQLYPCFSSVSLARSLILNDLYVVKPARGAGVGSALLKAASEYGRSVGAIRLGLSTAVDNLTAQSLYLRHGWVGDSRFLHFNLSLENTA